MTGEGWGEEPVVTEGAVALGEAKARLLMDPARQARLAAFQR